MGVGARLLLTRKHRNEHDDVLGCLFCLSLLLITVRLGTSTRTAQPGSRHEIPPYHHHVRPIITSNTPASLISRTLQARLHIHRHLGPENHLHRRLLTCRPVLFSIAATQPCDGRLAHFTSRPDTLGILGRRLGPRTPLHPKTSYPRANNNARVGGSMACGLLLLRLDKKTKSSLGEPRLGLFRSHEQPRVAVVSSYASFGPCSGSTWGCRGVHEAGEKKAAANRRWNSISYAYLSR